jgi:hypothetical protein
VLTSEFNVEDARVAVVGYGHSGPGARSRTELAVRSIWVHVIRVILPFRVAPRGSEPEHLQESCESYTDNT